jgi:SAM-dependent methyltransferase
MVRKLVSRFRRWFLGDALWGLPGELPDLHRLLQNDRALRLNVKAFGYRIARELAPRLAAIDTGAEPRDHQITCMPARQRDVESSWFAYWCSELKIAPVFHRKIWEYAFVLQALFDHGKLGPGLRALGFGCGEEPMAAYFASKGIEVTVTDLDPAVARGRGWMETGQHTSALDQAYEPQLVDRATFERSVRLEYVDMNDIPARLNDQHDFCWSICALEHLGSIENGLRFVERAMATLKPGGLAVHTTEFNYMSENETVDYAPVVLFLKKHFLDLKDRLERAGHVVKPLDFAPGDGVLDRFIDLPPYAWEGPEKFPWGSEQAHLKLSVDGYPTTCFGLIIQKRT